MESEVVQVKVVATRLAMEAPVAESRNSTVSDMGFLRLSPSFWEAPWTTARGLPNWLRMVPTALKRLTPEATLVAALIWTDRVSGGL